MSAFCSHRPAFLFLLERVLAPKQGAPHQSERLFQLHVEWPTADLLPQRSDELSFHRVRQHGDFPTAARARERRGERSVARHLALRELHLLVAFEAEEFHRTCSIRVKHLQDAAGALRQQLSTAADAKPGAR